MIVLKYNSTKWQVIGKIMNEPDPIVTKKEPLSAPVGNDRCRSQPWKALEQYGH